MTRTRTLILSAVVGVALAGGVAIASGAGTPGDPAVAATTPTLAPQPTSPAVGARIGMGMGAAGIAATARVVATQPDPAGGAPWAVRTFQRRALATYVRGVEQPGRGLVWCAQLGRIVGGQFVWIMPGAERVGPLKLDEGETTSCATTSPIAQDLGVMIASMPDRPVRDLQARIGATVLWGAVDGPVETARVDQGGRRIPISPVRHGFLHVMPGATQATLPRLVVRDRGGAARYAVPPTYFAGGAPLILRPGGLMPVEPTAGELARPGLPRNPNLGYAIEPTNTRQTATYSLPSDDVPQGLFAPTVRTPRPCYIEPRAAVAGRPVIAERWDGMVRQPPMFCSRFLAGAADRPTVLRGGWGSRDITYGKHTPAARLGYQRRVWQRIPPGSGGILVSVPPGAALLEVRSPVGVKTVRVGPSRITWVGWAGQPEVQRALFSMAVRRKDGSYSGRFRGNVILRALDAAGKQIGRTGSSAPRSASVRR